MNDQVSVSWQGMDQLVSMTRDQYLNLSEASGFTCAGGLNNTGAFSGFLGFFRGAYEEALATVTDSINEAMDAAQRLSTTIDDVRADLRATDTGVAELHSRLEARVECQGYFPGRAGDIPQINDQVINANDLFDNGVPLNGPKPPSWIPEANTNSPIDLADNLMSLAEDADATGSGLDHAEDADDYIEEHGR